MAPQAPSPRSGGRVFRRVLIGIGIVVLVVIAGIGIVVATFDPNGYKPQLAAAVRNATGRDLVINGKLALKLSLQPALEANDVALANPPGYSRPAMATLQRMEVQLALMPLLHRQVQIVRLVLIQPDILLETAANGQPNWAMGPAPPATTPPAQSGEKMGFSFRTLSIEGGQVAWRDDATGATTALALSRVDATTQSPSGPLHVTAAGQSGSAVFSLTADTGSLDRLQDPTATTPWPIKLALGVGGAKITLDGSVAHPADGRGLSVALTADVPDLAALSALAQAPLPGLKGLALQAKLSDAAPGGAPGFHLQDLKMTLPQADFAGDLSAEMGARPMVRGTLSSQKIDEDALRAVMGSSSAATPPPPARPASGRLIPDTPLPFPLLRLADANLTISVATLINGGVTYHGINAHLVAQNGKATLDPLAVDLPGGHLAGTLVLDATASPPTAALTLQSPGLALQPLLAAFGKPGTASGNLELRAHLHGAGETPQAIAAGLEGTLGLDVVNGRIDTQMLGGLLGGVLEKINLLSLLQHASVNDLRCFAARVDSHEGVGTFRTLLLDTSLLSMTGTGSVNLRNETISLRLRPQTSIAGTGLVAPVIVDGSLRSPDVHADTIGTITGNAGAAAGLALGAVTGGGLLGAVVGGRESSGGGDSGCGQALALARGTQPAAATPAPAAPPPARPAPKLPNSGSVLQRLFR